MFDDWKRLWKWQMVEDRPKGDTKEKGVIWWYGLRCWQMAGWVGWINSCASWLPGQSGECKCTPDIPTIAMSDMGGKLTLYHMLPFLPVQAKKRELATNSNSFYGLRGKLYHVLQSCSPSPHATFPYRSWITIRISSQFQSIHCVSTVYILFEKSLKKCVDIGHPMCYNSKRQGDSPTAHWKYHIIPRQEGPC